MTDHFDSAAAAAEPRWPLSAFEPLAIAIDSDPVASAASAVFEPVAAIEPAHRQHSPIHTHDLKELTIHFHSIDRAISLRSVGRYCCSCFDLRLKDFDCCSCCGKRAVVLNET